MNYRPRPGIVLTKICDQNVLIPSRIAHEHCKSIRTLPLVWAITWEYLERGVQEEQIFKLHRIMSKKSEEEIRQSLDRFYEAFYSQGYLIKNENEREDL